MKTTVTKREATLRVELPEELAEQAERMCEDDPAAMAHVIRYGVLRALVYRSLRDREAGRE